MTSDDIIRMASKAGFRMRGDGWFDGGFHNEKFEHFAALVAAAERERRVLELAKSYRCGWDGGVMAEREACAKVCDERARKAPMGSDEQCEAEDCANAIRARDEK